MALVCVESELPRPGTTVSRLWSPNINSPCCRVLLLHVRGLSSSYSDTVAYIVAVSLSVTRKRPDNILFVTWEIKTILKLNKEISQFTVAGWLIFERNAKCTTSHTDFRRTYMIDVHTRKHTHEQIHIQNSDLFCYPEASKKTSSHAKIGMKRVACCVSVTNAFVPTQYKKKFQLTELGDRRK